MGPRSHAWLTVLCALASLAGSPLARAQVQPELYFEADGEGPPVLFVADWGHDSGSWFRLLPALRPGRFLIRYDLRGQGRSELPADGDYSLEAHRGDLLRVLDGLAVERAHVVAAGLGARLALAAATARPDRIASLALINPHLAWTAEERAWWARFLAAHARSGRPSLGDYAALLVERWYGTTFVAGQPWLVPYYDLMLRRQDTGALVAALEVWLGTDLALGPEPRPSIPILILRGGRTTPTFGAERVQAVFPRLERALLERSGQVPQLDDPTEIGRLLAEFLPAEP